MMAQMKIQPKRRYKEQAMKIIYRKTISVYRRGAALLAAAALVLTLGACTARQNHAQWQQPAQELFSQLAADAPYGENAWRYLEFIQQYLGHRTAGSEQEKDMAEFIVSALNAMGYSRENIWLQHFAFDQDPSLAVEPEPLTQELLDRDETHKSQNVILTIPGKSEQTILVGAHYDSVKTHGVDDNGSGVALLLESALAMADEEPMYTIRYVFFGAEEVGMEGSSHYVKCMEEAERQNTVCMINADSVLAGDYRYILGGVSQYDGTVTQTELLLETYDLAMELGLDVRLNGSGSRFPQYTGTQKSDHYAFAALGIPYLYFWADNLEHSQAQETEALGQIMHTENDDLDVIVETFGQRAQSTLTTYAHLLDALLHTLGQQELDV